MHLQWKQRHYRNFSQQPKTFSSWEWLLFASGGALELSKCFAYVMYWDLSGGTHRLVRPDEIPGCSSDGAAFTGPISPTYGDKSATRHHLATISPWEGCRTLGVRIAPARNWDDKYKFRREQARDLALRMSGAVLLKEAARVGYRSMLSLSLIHISEPTRPY